MPPRSKRANLHPTEYPGARYPHHGAKIPPDICPECNLPRRGPHSREHERCNRLIQRRLDAEAMARKRPGASPTP